MTGWVVGTFETATYLQIDFLRCNVIEYLLIIMTHLLNVIELLHSISYVYGHILIWRSIQLVYPILTFDALKKTR